MSVLSIRSVFSITTILFFVLFFSNCEAILRVGVAKFDGTPPIGTPLAGFNHGPRRVPEWPLPYPDKYTTFMMPSIGVLDPIWVKVVVIDDGTTSFAFLTLDGVGSDGTLNALAYDIAVGMGFKVPFDNCLFSSSHSHSGPGAISPSFLWAMAPATDLLVPELQRLMATYMANAMVRAEQNKVPAKMNVTSTTLLGVTQNRRAGISPRVKRDTIDEHLGVFRFDDADGKPLATIWNFAIHGVCYGPDNMQFSGDIMGYANMLIEQQVGGVSLFINADAGDIDPGPGMCDPRPNFKGSALMAQAVIETRAKMPVTDVVSIRAASKVVPFGPTQMNLTLARLFNCTQGGPIDICSLCMIFDCDENLELYSQWLENSPRFTALNLNIAGEKIYVGSIPGEPLLELGWWLRNDTANAGFRHTILAGYSNNHMGYFAPPDEYNVGGYESQLTFWGIQTAQLIRQGFDAAMELVR